MIILIVLFWILSITSGMKFENYVKIDELIVGGKPLNIEDMPHIAGLYYRNFFFCAGSIVSHLHIVTAAHCLYLIPSSNRRFVSVRVGTSRVHMGGHSVQPKQFHIHPKFTMRAIDYDVAVIELESSLKFNSGIKPLTIADTEPPEGHDVRVSGWGYLRESGPPSRVLQSVIVKMVNRDTCAKNYAKRLKITERMICAWEYKKDACYGDSGGPMVYRGKLVGIVSLGEGCARKDFPGVYTNVANADVNSFIHTKAELKKPKKKKKFFFGSG